MIPRDLPSKSRPHVLWVLSTLSHGGTESFTVQVMPHLMKRARVTVLLTEGRGELYEDLAATGVGIIEAPLRGKFHRERILRAERLIRAEAPDVVHTHSLSPHYLVRIGAILAGTASILPHFHGLVGASLEGDLAERERRLLASTSRVLFVSEAGRREYERAVMAGSAEASRYRRRLEVVHDGLDFSAFSNVTGKTAGALRREYGLVEGAPVIGKVGRLHPVKNLELLIEVVAALRSKLPGLRCLIVGDGEAAYRAELQALARRRGVGEAIVYTGYRRDVAAHLALMDVALVTSHSEGLPRSVMEAFALGVPVVASRIAGMEEVIEDGVNGYLAAPGEAAAFADRVGALLEQPRRRAAFSAEAKRRAERYEMGAYTERLVAVYRKTLGRRSLRLRQARTRFRTRFRLLKRI